MAGELLLVPISRCSCSHFSPPSYFCWVIGDQLPGPGDVCGIWGNVSRGFQLHGLGQANRANTLGIDEEGTLQKRTGEQLRLPRERVNRAWISSGRKCKNCHPRGFWRFPRSLDP